MTLPWLVVGSARCVWSDLQSLPPHAAVIAVNRMSLDYPRALLAVATGHPELASTWSRCGAPVWAPSWADGVTHILPRQAGWNGASGLYGVQLAIHLGARRIILAGVPMDATPHYYDEATLDWHLANYRQGWINAAPDIRGRVASLSGWTRELLGGPEIWKDAA